MPSFGKCVNLRMELLDIYSVGCKGGLWGLQMAPVMEAMSSQLVSLELTLSELNSWTPSWCWRISWCSAVSTHLFSEVVSEKKAPWSSPETSPGGGVILARIEIPEKRAFPVREERRLGRVELPE